MRVVMCTQVYIGKDVSADGHAIYARSCDLSSNKNTITTPLCSPKVENKPGRQVKSIESKIVYDYPDTTYKCLTTPIIPATDYGKLTSIGLNEHGFIVTGTITAYNCPEIAKVDPFLDDGICEETLPDFIGKTCKTPKEAIDFIEKTMEEKGNYSANSLIVADQKEGWLIELYSGHQWAAIKLPTDKISVYGNLFMIQTEYEMDNPETFRHSKDLFKMPTDAGLAVMKDGKMSLCATYGGKDRLEDYSNLRTYMGHYYFAKSTAGEYHTKTRYPLFFDPDKKVSLKDVFNIYRFRYEGTPYCPEETGCENIRQIATEATFNCHAIQVFEDEKPQLASVAWLSIANPEHSTFLPYSNMITKLDPRLDKFDELTNKLNDNKFLKDIEDMPIMYSEDIAQVIFKRLCIISEHDRKLYGKGVQEYWGKKEDKLIKEFPKVLAKASKLAEKSLDEAIDYINDWTLNLQSETIDEAKTIFDQLI